MFVSVECVVSGVLCICSVEFALCVTCGMYVYVRSKLNAHFVPGLVAALPGSQHNSFVVIPGSWYSIVLRTHTHFLYLAPLSLSALSLRHLHSCRQMKTQSP